MFVFQYEFRRLCLCFDVDFRLGFGLCLHFGFVFRAWVSASLCVSGWVFAGCSQSIGFNLGCSYFYSFFFCFSNLGFAHISTHFFCSSSLVLDGFWSWWWRCGCAVVSRLNSAAEPGFLYVCI